VVLGKQEGTDVAGNRARLEQAKMQRNASLADTKMRADEAAKARSENAAYAMERLKTGQEGTTERKVPAITQAFDSHPLTRQYLNMQQSSDQVLEGLNEGTQVGQALAYVQTARAAGEKGPLSNFDVQTYSGRKDILGRMETYIKQNVTGLMTDKQAAELRKMAEGLKTLGQAGFDKWAKLQARQHDNELGLSAQQWYDKFTGAKGEVGGERSGTRFSSGGKTYTIPAGREQEFLKDHPDAERL